MTEFYPEKIDTDTSTQQVTSINVSEDYDLLDESAHAEVEVTRPFNRWERRVLEHDFHLTFDDNSFDLRIPDNDGLADQIDKVLTELDHKATSYRLEEERKREAADRAVDEARRRIGVN